MKTSATVFSEDQCSSIQWRPVQQYSMKSSAMVYLMKTSATVLNKDQCNSIQWRPVQQYSVKTSAAVFNEDQCSSIQWRPVQQYSVKTNAAVFSEDQVQFHVASVCKYTTFVDIEKHATKRLVTHLESHVTRAQWVCSTSENRCYITAINNINNFQSSEAVWKSRWPSWAPCPY